MVPIWVQKLQNRAFPGFLSCLYTNQRGSGPLGASYLVGDGLDYNVDITGNLSHIADLEPSLGLITHQHIAEDELIFILHIQPSTLYGLEDVVQVGAGTDLVFLKYHDVVVSHKG